MSDIDNIFPYKQVAIAGGGNLCKAFLKALLHRNSIEPQRILAVADSDSQLAGIEYAKQQGIVTLRKVSDLLSFSDLDCIIELTGDHRLLNRLRHDIPAGITLIDHFDAQAILDQLRFEREKNIVLQDLQPILGLPDSTKDYLIRFLGRVQEIVSRRHHYAREDHNELVSSERAMAQIIQGSTIPTFVIDRDHQVTHWNRACEKLTGYNATEMVGTDNQWKPFRSRKRPIMADLILDAVGDAEVLHYYGARWRKSPLIDGAFEADEHFPKLGDNGKWLFFTAAPIKNSAGDIVGAIETLWDKTEDKHAAEQLQQYAREIEASERATAQIIEGSTVATFVIDKAHRITHWNKAMEKLSGYTAESMIHTQKQWLPFWENERPAMADVVLDRMDASEIEKLYRDWRKSPLIEGAYEAEEFFKKLGKNGRWCFFTAAPIKGPDGSIIGAIETLLDRTEYKQAEEKYHSLFDNDPSPIFILNPHTLEIVDLNQRARDGYGYQRQEILGTSFLTLGEDEDMELEKGLSLISKNASMLFTRKRHYQKDGRSFYVNINVCAAKYGDEDVLIATTTDITETVEKETQLIQASKLTTLGQMAAGMAHEINQPLNVIQVCADYLKKMVRKGIRIEEQDLINIADDLENNAQRASGIIKHMRAFSRQSNFERYKVDINEPIKDVFKVLGNQLKAHNIELELDLAADLPPILADHNRLEQVFINLVTNAVDAMDEKAAKGNGQDVEKKLTIRSGVESDQIVVSVSDTGTGMSRDVIDKIFEPFFTTKAVGKGTGLGVSISYGIVKDYEGEIEIASEPGKGATFTLKFPAAKPSNGDAHE